MEGAARGGGPGGPTGGAAASATGEPDQRVSAVRALLDRSSGLLLHITSLPSPHGIGDLGPEAKRFASALAAMGQRWWQMLPIGPTGYGNSPYQAVSAFAGNPLLISLEAAGFAAAHPERPSSRVRYGRVMRDKGAMLRALAVEFLERADAPTLARFDDFRARESWWLGEYTLYASLKEANGGRHWIEWDAGSRDRDPATLAEAARELSREMATREVFQFLFAQQWRSLRSVCVDAGIGLVGDLPLYVAHDSADVWANRRLFELDDWGHPVAVAGVPPDYFSETGQRWGNPLYDWEAMIGEDFLWWRRRLKHLLDRFDAVRLDHFRGLAGYWAIPASEPTAVRGEWRQGPGKEFLGRIELELGAVPLIAEDLGFITEDVVALRKEFRLPGIRVAQFGFDDAPDSNIHDPEAFPRDVWGYTGTHDNDTTCGWFWEGADRAEDLPGPKRALLDRIGRDEVNWGLIELVAGSAAAACVFPVQDLLGLGTEARMNTPATESGNWEWRLQPGQLTEAVMNRMRTATAATRRV